MGQGKNFPDPSNITASVEHQQGSTVLAYHFQLERGVKATEANRRCANTFDSKVSSEALGAPRACNRLSLLSKSARPSPWRCSSGRVPITPTSPTRHSPCLSV